MLGGCSVVSGRLGWALPRGNGAVVYEAGGEEKRKPANQPRPRAMPLLAKLPQELSLLAGLIL